MPGPAETFGASEDSGQKTTVFDDDDRPDSPAATKKQTRNQARADAHHIQKFVNQQGACSVGCSTCARGETY